MLMTAHQLGCIPNPPWPANGWRGLSAQNTMQYTTYEPTAHWASGGRLDPCWVVIYEAKSEQAICAVGLPVWMMVKEETSRVDPRSVISPSWISDDAETCSRTESNWVASRQDRCDGTAYDRPFYWAMFSGSSTKETISSCRTAAAVFRKGLRSDEK